MSLLIFSKWLTVETDFASVIGNELVNPLCLSPIEFNLWAPKEVDLRNRIHKYCLPALNHLNQNYWLPVG